jgi:hypothetical protein
LRSELAAALMINRICCLQSKHVLAADDPAAANALAAGGHIFV